MKKLIVLVTLFVTIMVQAQEKESPRTVSTSGIAPIERVTTNYRIRTTLNMEQLYYTDPQCRSLEEFKEKYFSALKEQGFDPSVFVEKKMDFLALGYQKEGTVLQFESSSLEKVEKLLNVKMNGVTLQYQFKSVLDPEKKETLLKQALADAKSNALKLCAIAGTSLGKIISISENAPKADIWNSYYNDHEEFLSLHVIYEMN